MRLITLAFCFCLLALGLPAARAQNLVTDPGFEDCERHGHVPPGWSNPDSQFACGENPRTGQWGAETNVRNSDTLSQTIATVAGDLYEFSFWVRNNGADGEFSASFDGAPVLDIVSDPPTTGYVPEDFTVTASGTSTVIAFTANSSSQDWDVDDVIVTDLSLPEPASLTLLIVAMVTLAGVRRSRRR
jgi:hypothetical protein